jgi:imidazolonepropionase-like amidohydrolase
VLIAHLEELIYSLFTPPVGDPLAAPPASVISEAVAHLKANHGFVVADLITFETMAEQWGKPEVVESYFARPEVKFVSFDWRVDWRRAGYVKKSGSLARRVEFEARLVRDLSLAGVKLVAGTDAPTIPGIVPGFSLHDNLDRLTKAGLTRFQALTTATRTPGEFVSATIGDKPRFGQIIVGYRADLILTESNPLDDLQTLREPSGVMAHGNWYTAGDLDAMMKEVVATYDAAASLSMRGKTPN